jgi:hypothetical protein
MLYPEAMTSDHQRWSKERSNNDDGITDGILSLRGARILLWTKQQTKEMSLSLVSFSVPVHWLSAIATMRTDYNVSLMSQIQQIKDAVLALLELPCYRHHSVPLSWHTVSSLHHQPTLPIAPVTSSTINKPSPLSLQTIDSLPQSQQQQAWHTSTSYNLTFV